MSSFKFSIVENPFTPMSIGFWGRQYELRNIYQQLRSEQPQSCTLVGETYSGKTTLLKRLVEPREPLLPGELSVRRDYTFVYLDCEPYDDSEVAKKGAYASMLFWWELYEKLYERLQSEELERFAKPDLSPDGPHLENAFQLKFEVENLIRNYPHHVVIILDNFEGVARLPLRDSKWLRSLGQLSCTFIVASRHLLHLLYQNDLEEQGRSSPIWNLFSDPIYLSLMDKEDVSVFLHSASEKARTLGSFWSEGDIKFIRRMAGCHPELIRIACMYTFDARLPNRRSSFSDQEHLDRNLTQDAQPICNQLWSGLADLRLSSGVQALPDNGWGGQENQKLSLYQKALLDIVRGREVVEENTRIILEQRGLIEFENDQWHIFSELMRNFVLVKTGALIGNRKGTEEENAVSTGVEKMPRKEGAFHQEYSHNESTLRDDSTIQSEGLRDHRGMHAFAYLEGKVYDYLYSHIEQVCDREDIKKFVWPDKAPTNSALQKIIERIRKKIDDDPEASIQLIAVRRRGYMLRINKDSSLP